MTESLYLEVDGPIATVVINRPEKRNAMTFEMWAKLPDLLSEFEESAALKVLVVRGAGDAAFSAGADITEFKTMRVSSEGTRRYDAAAGKAQDSLATLPKPTIAMIRGVCVGGGCGLALSCDLRFSDSTATFSITPARLGIVYPVNVTRRLVDLVGPAHAKSLLFTGIPIDAHRAYEIGLVQQVFDAESLESGTTAFGDTIASRSAYSVRSTKGIIDLVSAGLNGENEETLFIRGHAFDTEDYREGVRAFLDKREPNF